MVKHGGRQCGHRAGAANRRAPLRAENAVHGGRKVADKAAAVGQVDVMRTGRCGGPGHAVVLLLEGSGGVDQQLNTLIVQGLGEACGAVVKRHRAGALAEFLGQRSGALKIAPAHQQLDTRVIGQGAADARTKISIPSQDQRFQVHTPVCRPLSALLDGVARGARAMRRRAKQAGRLAVRYQIYSCLRASARGPRHKWLISL